MRIGSKYIFMSKRNKYQTSWPTKVLSTPVGKSCEWNKDQLLILYRVGSVAQRCMYCLIHRRHGQYYLVEGDQWTFGPNAFFLNSQQQVAFFTTSCLTCSEFPKSENLLKKTQRPETLSIVGQDKNISYQYGARVIMLRELSIPLKLGP